jgi:hypothetical protein
MEDQTNKYNSNALNWLYEMEAIDSPILKQNLYENVLFSDERIKDCAIFVTPQFTYQKGILVYIKLGFFTKLFKRKEIYSNITQVLQRLLPSYNLRIVEDINILQMAEETLRNIYESNNNNDIDVTKSSSVVKDGLQQTSDLLSDLKEQTKDRQEVRNETKQRDLPSDEAIQSTIEDLYSDLDAGEQLPTER